MKTQETHSPGVTKPAWISDEKRRRLTVAQPSGTHGVALVLVLALIALATVLVVAFMSNVMSSGIGEKAAASETSAAQLASSAVQLVEGTITHATEPTTDTTFAWACQPGMIRTYGTGSSASSDPLAYYKLYSSDNMVLSGATACNGFTGPSSNEVPQYWDMAPALYADLNTPLISSAGAPIFPILDPRAGDLGVEGFGVNTTPTIDGAVPVTGGFAADSGARVPMPVRWMYVLRDGTMTVPDGPGIPSGTKSTTATWSGNIPANAIPKPTNPIVGRVAFWTDDEDAKINVNTASEGTYWDTPISNSGSTSDAFAYPQTAALGDVAFANMQGAQHEYQRYPGHPATTCLSSVFGGVLSGLGSRANVVKAITDAVPRITDNASPTANSGMSSMGGTQSPVSSATSTPPPLTTDVDRLYASLDEFQFAPPPFTSTSIPIFQMPRPPTSGSAPSTAAQNIVDACRFFLTARSKAPELNMFGLPRVAMWPLWDPAVGTLTSFDQEILKCATVGLQASPSDPHRFAFFRANPLSATADFPISGIPPSSGNNAGAGVLRNRFVYGYLHNLMNRPVPGFGYSFASKYNTSLNDSDQILTEIFDYIRCTNLADNSKSADGTTGATPYTGTFGTGSQANVGSVGEVVPIQIPASAPQGGGTQGFGRIATISELMLVLIKVDDRLNINYPETTTLPSPTTQPPDSAVHIYPANTPNLATKVVVAGGASVPPVDPKKQTLLEWVLIPRLTSPMCGYVPLSNNIRIKFTNVNLSIGGNTISPASVADIYDTGRVPTNGRDAVMGGNIGMQSMVEIGVGGLQGPPPDSIYPTGLCVVSGLSGTANPISISGSVTVEVHAPAGATAAAAGPAIQTFSFTFPSMQVPIPQLFVNTSNNHWYGTFKAPPSSYNPDGSYTATGTTVTFNYPTTFNRGAIQRFMNGYNTYINSTEVIRSLVATGSMTGGTAASVMGDNRVVATAQTIPSTLFQETLMSNGVAPSSSTYAADAAVMGTLIYMPGNAHGALTPLIPATNYQYPPDVPPLPNGNSTGVTMPGNIPGDWDNAPGLMVDGPWINKPDEGMTENGTTLPYIGNYETMTHNGAPISTLFSPNRQISSPVMFGSLLTGADHPWRTLLFRPPALPGFQGFYTHPGNQSPKTQLPDHLLLDLFWMPIVEPYGISEPFATSGKINLNTQIQPFTYIKRTTGMNAVLKPVMITALNPSTPGTNDMKFVGTRSSYKWSYGNAQFPKSFTRYPIDADQTLLQTNPASADQTALYPEFSRGTHTAAAPNFFVSPSQICDVPLVPLGYKSTNLATFWRQNSLTGDNSLERPYSMIYPRVTTKSNIFTVHVLAQSLKKIVTDSNQNTWNEGKDVVTSEYHAAYTVEKYFDPNTDDITTDAAGTMQSVASQDDSISSTAAIRKTKWRLLSVKRFGQ